MYQDWYYVLMTGLFLVGAIMFIGGFVWRTVDTGGFDDVGADVASAIGLIAVYAIVMVASESSLNFFNTIFGGLPYVSAIADYNSIANVWKEAPDVFAKCFFDVVLLSAIIDLIKPVLGAGKRVPFSMRKLFTVLVSSLLGLLLLNVVVKKLSVYSVVVSAIGALITAVSTTGFFFNVVTTLTKRQITTGLFAVVALFLNNPVSKMLRSSFIKACFYVGLIYLMEIYCGSIAGGVSLAINILIAFAPCAIMLFGIGLAWRSLK